MMRSGVKRMHRKTNTRHSSYKRMQQDTPAQNDAAYLNNGSQLNEMRRVVPPLGTFMV
jgi:hypothetical protein